MTTTNKNGHLLLYSGSEWYRQLSLEEIQRVISQNKAWVEKLAAEGKVKGGQGLVRQGAIVSAKGARPMSDGPFAESKEAIGGFLLLDVDSFEEAVAIAQTSPSIRYGTTIEVRPVAEECPLDTVARELAREELVNA